LATRSAEKAHRQSLKRKLRNRAVKSATKTAVKKANAAILAGDLDAAREATRAALISLDRASQKGVIHANNAARHKSRLLIKYNAAVAVQQLPAASIDAPTAKERAKKAPAAKGSGKAKRPVAKKATKK
jgi:small subunit ribosomal protein S20